MWPRVVARHPDAMLVVAGEGDDRARLEARARELDVARAVKFVGAVNDKSLRRCTNNAAFS